MDRTIEWTIEPRRPQMRARLAELWEHRPLVNYFGRWFLSRTYQRTVLGWAWVLIRPLVTALVGTLVFRGLLKVDSQGAPYFLFYLIGMTAWQLFDNSLMWSTRSLELNRRLITKVYFPRLVLPVASLLPAIVEHLVSWGLVFAVALGYFAFGEGFHLVGGLRILTTVAAATVILLFGLSLGLWLSVPASHARDVRFTLRYVLGFWFLVTPGIYTQAETPQMWRWALHLNPMAAFVDTFRWGIMGLGRPDPTAMVAGAGITLVALSLGLWFFGRAESAAIDRL